MNSHGFWRMRHDPQPDRILFETAPSVGGMAGEWTTRASDDRQINLSALFFELKAGTYQAEAQAPGTAKFDNSGSHGSSDRRRGRPGGVSPHFVSSITLMEVYERRNG